MTTKGIIFSAPMVRALLDGRKTQTRRLLTLRGFQKFTQFGPSDTPGYDWHFRRADGCWCDFSAADLPQPYYTGDRLYVRECIHKCTDPIDYRASRLETDPEGPWIPSIHMPRWASRLWLAVTDVRVQRLQDISEGDAIAEGCAGFLGPMPDFPDQWDPSPREEYQDLWNSLHAAPGTTWADNPWIVAVTFDVHHGNVDA